MGGKRLFGPTLDILISVVLTLVACALEIYQCVLSYFDRTVYLQGYTDFTL